MSGRFLYPRKWRHYKKLLHLQEMEWLTFLSSSPWQRFIDLPVNQNPTVLFYLINLNYPFQVFLIITTNASPCQCILPLWPQHLGITWPQAHQTSLNFSYEEGCTSNCDFSRLSMLAFSISTKSDSELLLNLHTCILWIGKVRFMTSSNSLHLHPLYQFYSFANRSMHHNLQMA